MPAIAPLDPPPLATARALRPADRRWNPAPVLDAPAQPVPCQDLPGGLQRVLRRRGQQPPLQRLRAAIPHPMHVPAPAEAAPAPGDSPPRPPPAGAATLSLRAIRLRVLRPAACRWTSIRSSVSACRSRIQWDSSGCCPGRTRLCLVRTLHTRQIRGFGSRRHLPRDRTFAKIRYAPGTLYGSCR